MTSLQTLPIESGLLAMPAELRKFAIQNCVSSSPYNRYASGSFYSMPGKTWDYTPEGTIRISDHWNFWSRGEMHCKTDVDNAKLIGKWAVGEYNSITDTYTIISIDEKDFSALNTREQRRANKNFKTDLELIKEKVITRYKAKVRRIELRKARAKKQQRLNDLKNGFIFYSGIVTDYYRRAGGWYGSKSYRVFGQVYNESACRTNGRLAKNYKEIDIRNYVAIKKELQALLALENINAIKPAIKENILQAYNDIITCGARDRFLNF